MKLLIIRHAEPDYSIDSLTEKGWREAELLKQRLIKREIDFFYTSPLGRAKDTAKPTLEALGKHAEICPWLREFDGVAINPDTGKETYAWDRTPEFISRNEDYFDRRAWAETPFIKSGDVKEKYDAVCRGLDGILARHGYVHTGTYFSVKEENRKTIALFCHFGVECVLLSHLLNISPMALWQGFVALPSSVTELATEEREQGIASFRCSRFGDLSHLYAGNEEPSFYARFCENYSAFDERHETSH